jgi:salicylate hydroxylase
MPGLQGREVHVAGAGVAGLAVAAALAQRGAQVTVFEQAPTLRPVGAGLQISPNGAAVLAALGVEVSGRESHAVELRDHAMGARVLRLDLRARRYGQPFLLVHRADLIAALEARAQALGVRLELGARVEATALDAPLVIAADGVKSTLRGALNAAKEPFFTRQVAWRAVIAEDPSAVPEARVYMGPGRHLVTYPLAGGRRNIVAVEERAEWVEEDWDLADDPASLRQAFKGFAPEVQGWLQQVKTVKLWGLFRHEVAARWQDGRRVLIGDAAHPTLPFLAQGANLALEDALLLARHLEASEQGAALEAFEAVRRPRVSSAIETANGNARNYHLSHPLMRGTAHTGLMLRRFDWLYGFDPSKAAL